jgi:hypothetical protein
MKKIILLLMCISMGFISCETEPLNNDNVNGVAAKGKIKKESLSSDECTVNLLPDLPAMVAEACTTDKPGIVSYFDLSIADGALAGDYAAWCVDVENTLEAPDCFEANVFSSYEVLPDGVVDRPENFDLINWILNQDFVGKNSDGGVGDPYTLGDVQWAMWALIDDTNCVACTYLTPYDAARAQEIVDLAVANGEGYEPGEGDVLAIVLQPTDGKQVVIIPYTVECEPEGGCETAYAREKDGDNCFIDNGFSRWGWSLEIPEHGEYSYDFYAGAGQCDITKGTQIGTVDVVYSADGVEVTYNAFPGYTIDDIHTYAGTAMFPTKNGADTVAPGQYTIQDGLGDLGQFETIYVIAHAGEACVE